jgi:hypothetical protein
MKPSARLDEASRLLLLEALEKVTKPPALRWMDEAGIERFVLEALKKAEVAARRARIDVSLNEVWRELEQDAVEKAKRRGDFRPLSNMVMSRIPLSYEARILIVDKLHNRFRLPKKRPPETPEEKRERYPIYVAAETFAVVQNILRKMFPDQDHYQVRYRAIQIAAKRSGVSVETLDDHVTKRARKRRI